MITNLTTLTNKAVPLVRDGTVVVAIVRADPTALHVRDARGPRPHRRIEVRGLVDRECSVVQDLRPDAADPRVARLDRLVLEDHDADFKDPIDDGLLRLDGDPPVVEVQLTREVRRTCGFLSCWLLILCRDPDRRAGQ